jgi:hypothetical protein
VEGGVVVHPEIGAHQRLPGKAPGAALQNVTATKVDAEVLDLALASLGI